MPQPSDAEDHLRIIRSLMEKATIYRAISSQAALAGGLLAVAAGGMLAGKNDLFVNALAALKMHSSNAELFGFQLKWIVVLILCILTNLHYLHRDARRRQEAFVSPGMRMALTAMIPPLFTGAVVTSLWSREGLPQMWMIFYGLALLSTAHFAPTSLVRLGWAFLLTGLTLQVVNGEKFVGLSEHVAIPQPGPREVPSWTYTDALMACTFGGYHLVYAAFTSRRAPAAKVPLAA